ncbi:two-component system, OmpR family, manganese sensing response regulator [Thermostichus sp. MS-CIW-21]|jgi:OmpR-family two-component system manganese-sensing response regulator|uniref:two-component system response regulator RppA n=1 Tax=unclassified Synechococcus TaxID=2626047 RepID=UPI000069403F|nr:MULTISPECIES: two-component system response regulator RppA [unclassified Synechococcus]ABC98640.1 DNA-binding response regulator [Synechococcus sp. JA-3-3Ab]PIK85891.1 PhoB family transcriptional regulator [Synechococcus sp. 63AY4M2]PIK89152.1 PhoB family transcriptional regulator [Synechococcus sp. 65AY6A5]PIK91240.1 PhoB family transcriptional regulator [Synechococcus sp. 65AY6Li]PIK94952.1 PhoB family transcriptional regulator [Synechococcus sp. 60AY4M2]
MARILLVDDEVELADSLAQHLRREGHSVDVAYEGNSAWELLQKPPAPPYDLLVLDWMLPGLSGLSLCQQVRQVDRATPILFLTAKDTLDDRVEGLDAGADDYLVKPFELRELLARVRALLRRAAGPGEGIPRLQIGDLELDRENQVAYRQGRMIHLSQKEFRLLEYFMAHPGQLLTHEQIYERVWAGEDPPSSNVLAAQVRLLRRRLRLPGSPELIHAVYGKGYRFGPVAEDPQQPPTPLSPWERG